jgi:hypothetical protein
VVVVYLGLGPEMHVLCISQHNTASDVICRLPWRGYVDQPTGTGLEAGTVRRETSVGPVGGV